MNLIYTICAGLVLAFGLQALDVHTDPACAELKKVIELAQPIEKVQDVWDNMVKSDAVSGQDKAQLATQLIAYAQEQKNTLEAQVTQLGTKSYDSSRLRKGIIKTEFGKWCALGFIYMVCSVGNDGATDQRLPKMLFPDILAAIININKDLTSIKDNLLLIILLTCIITRPLLAAWAIPSGIEDIAEALTHKLTLEIKIKNLTASIAFLQQSNTQS